MDEASYRAPSRHDLISWLEGVWVDYDRLPYESGTASYDRLLTGQVFEGEMGMGGKRGKLWRLDSEGVSDLLDMLSS